MLRSEYQHLVKVYKEISSDDSPSKMNTKSIGFPFKIKSFGRNIAINGKIHAIINVTPVESNLLIINGRMLFLLSALIAPSLSLFALLKIEMAARTKPNKIPETVERTPAVVITSGCFIGLKIKEAPYAIAKRRASFQSRARKTLIVPPW
ncbi:MULTISPECIES: hypothetical protein [Enterobacter]|uniref:hypothetical protein n=1 Tax=Enterobacter sp. BH2-YP2023 TaxID=3402818 RepID=UPI002FD70FA9